MHQRHKKTRLGYDYLHSAVDDRTRLAYTEALPDETDPTCAAFLTRALAFFRDHGIRVRRLLTDNAMVYRPVAAGPPCARRSSSSVGSSSPAAHS